MAEELGPSVIREGPRAQLEVFLEMVHAVPERLSLEPSSDDLIACRCEGVLWLVQPGGGFHDEVYDEGTGELLYGFRATDYPAYCDLHGSSLEYRRLPALEGCECRSLRPTAQEQEALLLLARQGRVDELSPFMAAIPDARVFELLP